MRWSDQSIEQAIQTAKARNAIFVVYVEDDANPSPFHSILESSDVTGLLMNEQFVCIRIRSSSQSYRDFTSIYQLVPIPSLFFIGQNGWPLEIIAGELAHAAVVQRIQNLLGQSYQHTETPPSGAPHLDRNRSDENSLSTTSTYTASATTTTTLPCLTTEEEFLLSGIMDVVHSETEISSHLSNISVLSSAASDVPNPVSTDVNTVSSDTPSEIPSPALSNILSSVGSNNSNSDSGEDEETRKRLSKSPTDNFHGERNLDNNPTLFHATTHVRVNPQHEFRSLQQDSKTPSQGVAPLKSDLSLPLASGQPEATGRTTDDCQPVPEPVTGFLASFGGWIRSFLGGNATAPSGSQTAHDRRRPYLERGVGPNSRSSANEPSTSNIGGQEFAHIQFRLHDGSTHSRMFMANTTMSEVRQYVQNNIALPFRDFGLSTSYPRIVFTNEHLQSTVSELGLVPRSVILIVPGVEGSRSPYTAATNVFWTLVAWPFSAMYSLVAYLNIWFHGGTEAAVNDQAASRQPQSRAEQQPRNQNPAFGNTSGVRRRLPSSSTVQRDGNIYRLSNRQDDSDDENNTWNGNSTQQM